MVPTTAVLLCFLILMVLNLSSSTLSASAFRLMDNADVHYMGPFIPHDAKERHVKWPNQSLYPAQSGVGHGRERLRRDKTERDRERERRTTPRSKNAKTPSPVNADERVVVQTQSGLVRGVRKRAMGIGVDLFVGVPYAKPPVGELRFKKPVPIDPWPGVYPAVTPPNSCQQEPYDVFPGFRGEEMWNPNTNISEDCLYLNIWAPSSWRRPSAGATGATVLIWIYGGGYMSGTSTLDVYDALILAATNDVIVASINYRVGAFGFLYLDTDDAPGNMGLYDQALAINWIKNNIHVHCAINQLVN